MYKALSIFHRELVYGELCEHNGRVALSVTTPYLAIYYYVDEKTIEKCED